MAGLSAWWNTYPFRSPGGRCGVVAVEDGVDHAADRADHRDGAVAHRDHRGQPARFEHAGHHQQVGAGVDEVGQFLAVSDLEVAVGVVVEVVLEVPEVAADAVVVERVAEQHELGPAGQRVKQGVMDQVHAFLLVQPAHVGDDRAPGLAQQEPVPEAFFVVVLAVQGADRIAGRDERVDLGVPHVVVHAVEDAAELDVMHVQGLAEPEAAVAMAGLTGVVG